MTIGMQNIWVKASVIILAVGVGLLILGLLVLMIWSIRQELQDQNKRFLGGSDFSTKLDGFYKGSLQGSSSWQGKKFDSKTDSGINVFSEGERYRFSTSTTQGLKSQKQVLKLDYNQAGNPGWLRLIVDEAVETSPGNYQGKVYLRLKPFTFTITYFELHK